MNRSEFITAFANEKNIPISESREICEAIFDFLKEKIQTEPKVVIKDFGIFRHKTRAARKISCVTTGETMVVPERDAIVFEISTRGGSNTDEEEE